MSTRPRAVVVCSGGMDSTTLVAHYHETRDVSVVSFDYGQRHRRELASANAVADHYGIPFDWIDLRSMGRLFTGSALTDDLVDVPDGHYTEDSMTATIVPNRNAIMANIAVGIAIAREAPIVALGIHAGDHAVYPDCRPEFVYTLNRLIWTATQGSFRTSVEAPFLHSSKADIVSMGAELGAPLELSWSCYKGGDRHCGRCGTCVERAEAFHLADVPDPTIYSDPDYWRTAVASR